ncbi:MAG: hypothetical protein HOQ24_00360 [Mycobacteriaceae bacterium]|nr:hypothetical protein [Mycobacteriaceae bacterium]
MRRKLLILAVVVLAAAGITVALSRHAIAGGGCLWFTGSYPEGAYMSMAGMTITCDGSDWVVEPAAARRDRNNPYSDAGYCVGDQYVDGELGSRAECHEGSR